MTNTSAEAVEFQDMSSGDMRGLLYRQSDTIAALRAKLTTVEDEREVWYLLVDDLCERLASAEAQVKDVEAGQEMYGEDDWQAMKNIAYRAGYYQAECGLPIDDNLPELNLKLCGKVLKAQRRVSNFPKQNIDRRTH